MFQACFVAAVVLQRCREGKLTSPTRRPSHPHPYIMYERSTIIMLRTRREQDVASSSQCYRTVYRPAWYRYFPP
jgi:hypothetical protein